MNFLASIFVRSQKAGKKAALSELTVIPRANRMHPTSRLMFGWTLA